VSGSSELGRALHAWRDRTAPAAVGVPAGGVRRAAGLRREELAQLASLSVDYIVRLEQGRATSPSVQVLSALARALRLSAAEREHLYLLAGQPAPGPGQVSAHIPSGVRRLLDQLDGAPLSVYDAAWNLILWNPLWAALFGDASGLRGRERNIVWRHFAGLPSPVSHTPEQEARFEAAVVADLRAATARYPADAGLRSLVKDLRGVSTHFAGLWDTGAVGVHETHTKTVHHPDAGTLTLDCDVLTAPGSDLRIVAYTAASGSDAAGRLKLLNVIGTQAMTEGGTPATAVGGGTPPMARRPAHPPATR
jgi:transcriptional regulator with XRE-family HTH domain